MATKPVRVRFAPSPTGTMHIGNISIALMNFLYAQQKGGTFILRIEDTDPERMFDPGAKQIMNDLAWLGISYQEGPIVGGPHEPYFQSERMHLYQQVLDLLISEKKAYRCFCTSEELDRRRARQIALKQPPRYDRACLALSTQEIEERVLTGVPFIWRMLLDYTKPITIKDMFHGDVHFDMKNFSDFPLTRQTGSVTFMFANFVDDYMMKITHIVRGEDHLTNTAGQAAMFLALGSELPTYWHMPIMCNIEGKKLSKRDFGFSLKDQRDAGLLPEAICNYLATIGGSYDQEIMSMDELVKNINFENRSGSNTIKYDAEKLRWVNHKWINRYEPEALTDLCLPFLRAQYEMVDTVDRAHLTRMIQIIKSDLVLLSDVVAALRFYFHTPHTTAQTLEECVTADYFAKLSAIIKQHLNLPDVDSFMTAVKKDAKEAGIPLKETFWFIRLCLMGASQGPSIHDLCAIIGFKEAVERLAKHVA